MIVEQCGATMEQWNSDGGKMWWNSTSLLHRACKCVSKYGIYHVCHTFALRLHHICS